MSLHLLGAGDGCAVIEATGDGAPAWRWWGPRITIDAVPPLAGLRAVPSFSLDAPVPLTITPSFGTGWFGAAALLASRDGRDAAPSFHLTSLQADEAAIIAVLVDQSGIELTQRIAANDGVLRLSASVRNTGDAPLTVDWLAAGTLPLPPDCAAIKSFTGRHNAEFMPHIEAMPAQGWLRENWQGMTGHAGPPGLFVLGSGADWHHGRVHAAQLAWSGNHRLRIDKLGDGGWALQMGEALAPGEVRLQPGEVYDTPDLIAAVTRDGLNGALQAFHAAIRARLPLPGGAMRPRPVHLNSWEGFYFAHDEAKAIALAERAAALGVERFVLDDGWFRGRLHDRAGLGDWTPDPDKYPRGLAPLVKAVTGLGMEFGLWVEPEMINPDSDLYRAHPDWVLAGPGAPRPTARHQLVLDLGRAEVRDHLFGLLDDLLRALPIAYLKWDHNRALAPAGGADGRPGYHAQIAGAHALIDRVRAAHPDVEIESCAGGGGRIDAAMAERAHRFWTSDNLDAVARIGIQRGFLHFMPPELMGAHVGAAPAHSTGRSQAMAFRAGVALPGHFGVELDPARIEAGDVTTLKGAIERYKMLRDRLHNGQLWLGEGSDGLVWQAHGAPGDLLLFVIRSTPAQDAQPPSIPLPMLRSIGAQRVRLLDLAAPAALLPEAFVAMQGAGIVLLGDWLAEAGLPLPPMRAESVALFAIAHA